MERGRRRANASRALARAPSGQLGQAFAPRGWPWKPVQTVRCYTAPIREDRDGGVTPQVAAVEPADRDPELIVQISGRIDLALIDLEVFDLIESIFTA